MPAIKLLTKSEQKAFNSPPMLTSEERDRYFQLPDSVLVQIKRLGNPTTKVGFALQYIYFKIAGCFFSPKQFPQSHMNAITKFLEIDSCLVNLSTYKEMTLKTHQEKILKALAYTKFDAKEKALLKEHIENLVEKRIRPKQILMSTVVLYHQKKIERPSYHLFSTLISDAYNAHEKKLLAIIDRQVTSEQSLLLDSLLNFPTNTDKQESKIANIIFLKYINQSTRPAKLQGSLNDFLTLKKLYKTLKPTENELRLSPEALRYYAAWVHKARTAQIKQFPNSKKRHLHLIAFVVHQYFLHQDALIDALLKSVRSAINVAIRKHKAQVFESRTDKDQSIKLLSGLHKNSRGLLCSIKEVIRSQKISDAKKLKKIETLIHESESAMDQGVDDRVERLEHAAEQSLQAEDFLVFLEAQSIELQRKISGVIKCVEFNLSDPADPLFTAITHFKNKEGEVGKKPPQQFIEKPLRKLLYDENGKFRISLYKILLFTAIADGIKSGKVTLTNSYRYLSLNEYLVDEVYWIKNRTALLKRFGLLEMEDLNSILNALKQRLDTSYCQANKNLQEGKNKFLSIGPDDKFILTTPAVDKPNTTKIAELLSPCKYTSIVQVLSSIHQVTNFADHFKHHSVKHVKGSPTIEAFIASILGLGCNIGANKIASTSKGIKVKDLAHIITWYFDLENINAANNCIIHAIRQLSLPSLFKKDIALLHSSSDGQKKNLSADSLNANCSFKYHGNRQGVSVYTFIDERCILFHSSVISSSEREAGYVLDGMLHNDEIQTNIHSTDTHGFSEIIFGLTHLLEVSFAPRIARLKEQCLYSFSSKTTYQDKGHEILPSNRLKPRVIKACWDDVLRLLVSIKLKESTASQILKRLSSYSSENALYTALQEFGRIIKTLFILSYIDDVELRQAIQKQLNRVELSNKFSNAVFFANNQEFSQGLKEDQEIAVNCKRLIQNAVILWNYLYLSQLLLEINDEKDKQSLLESISHGSILTWQHINMHGEYDFTAYLAKNAPQFDLEAIYQLEVA